VLTDPSQLIDASKHWRDSWADILNRQSAILSDYDIIYAPILTSDGTEADQYAVAPQTTLERVSVLKGSYTDLKLDMLEEVAMCDKRIIEPAKDARASLKLYKKVIKKREDRKLDYERYKGRVESVEKKQKRTDRDNTALAKHNIDLSKAEAVRALPFRREHVQKLTSSQAYHAADDELKSTLPGMTNAAYALLPPLLNAQIMIQNTLLGQLYTTLHNYSQDHGFPSPPPETEEVVAVFESDFTHLRLEAEQGIRMLAHGKAIHLPMDLNQGGKSYSGLGIRNHANGAIQARRGNSNTLMHSKPAAIMPSPSVSKPPSIDGTSKPQISSNGSWSRHGAMLSSQSASTISNPSPPASITSNSQSDYFAPASHSSQLRPRQPSTTSLTSTVSASSIAGKKKPPPPPPKRLMSQQYEYVTALYDFNGENAGDLSFKEGDRIKVIKKTGSDVDWWDGELRGAKGSFPANYCKTA